MITWPVLSFYCLKGPRVTPAEFLFCLFVLFFTRDRMTSGATQAGPWCHMKIMLGWCDMTCAYLPLPPPIPQKCITVEQHGLEFFRFNHSDLPVTSLLRCGTSARPVNSCSHIHYSCDDLAFFLSLFPAFFLQPVILAEKASNSSVLKTFLTWWTTARTQVSSPKCLLARNITTSTLNDPFQSVVQVTLYEPLLWKE